MSREYDQLAWVDYPETLTPISAANLNRMENGIANLYTDRNKMENNIAYVEEGETATRHYFINSYLMLNGIFYKTTSEINIGDILDPTLAGNIEHVDVSSQFGSGGGGSTGCVELTQAQYDALSDEAKMLDVIYLITDSPDNYLDEVFGDFASVEYTDTASKAYAVGDYLVYDSKFYKVTSAIAQGDTIAPDTNVVKTTVGEELDEINSNKAETYDWYKSNPDLNVGLITAVNSGGPDKSQAALQSHDGVNGWRLLMGRDGTVSKWKTTDSGANWTVENSVEIKIASVYNGAVSISTSSTDVTFSLPSGFHKSLGVIIERSWPASTWNPSACVSIRMDHTFSGTGKVTLSSTSTQTYGLSLRLLYI